MKKIILSLFVLLIAAQLTFAAEIQGKGKYKGKQLTTNGFTVRCGWQFWMTCWTIHTGTEIDDYMELGNGDIIGLELVVLPENGWDPFHYSDSETSVDVATLTVRPMYKTISDDPEDENCSTCFDYIYFFSTPQP